MTKSRTHYSGQPDRGRPVRRGHRPPGRRQQQPWASPSLQTATRSTVTRTESSEPVRQQLVRVSLEAAHCLSGCILPLWLHPTPESGLWGATCAPTGPVWVQDYPTPMLHPPALSSGTPGWAQTCAGHGATAPACPGVFLMQRLMAHGTGQGKCPQTDYLCQDPCNLPGDSSHQAPHIVASFMLVPLHRLLPCLVLHRVTP